MGIHKTKEESGLRLLQLIRTLDGYPFFVLPGRSPIVSSYFG